MPRKTRGMKGLRNVPEGSENWYWYPYDKSRSPKQKCVNLRATNQEAAIEEATGLRMKWIREEFDPWTDAYQPGRTLTEYVGDYLGFFSGQASATLANKRSLLDRFAAFVPTNIPAAVTEKHVGLFIDTLGAEGQAIAESTQTSRLAILRQFFSFLEDRGVLRENVAARYSRRRKQTLSKRQRNESSRRRTRFFTPDDIRRMAEAARTDTMPNAERAYFADVIEFVAVTGLRKSEMIHLNWRDVSLSEEAGGTVFVRCWESRHESFVTKNGKDRVIPLPPRASRILADLKERRTSDDGFEPVFKKPRLTGHTEAQGTWYDWRLHPTTVGEHFRFCRDACGLAHPDAVFHALRHTYISWMVMLRVPLTSLMKWTGHSSTNVFSGYVHHTDAYMTGRARTVQRDLARHLCPGLSEEALDLVFPEGLTAFSAHRPHVPAEDAVFGGLLYRPDVLAA